MAILGLVSGVFCMRVFAVLALLAVAGCSRGPTYDEALHRYTTERTELDRLTAVSEGIRADMQRIHEEHVEAKKQVAGSPAAVAKLDQLEKTAQDSYTADIAAMQKKIEAQTVRVAAAEKLKDSLQP